MNLSFIEAALKINVATTSSLVALIVAFLVYLVSDLMILALITWLAVCVINIHWWRLKLNRVRN